MRLTIKNILPFFALLFISIPALSLIQQDNIHTDGVYQSKPVQIGNEHSPYFYNYLRFFSNGNVISVSSPNTPKELKKWFVDTNKNISKGIYKIVGNHISFHCISPRGRVNYNGDILADSLPARLCQKLQISNSELEQVIIKRVWQNVY